MAKKRGTPRPRVKAGRPSHPSKPAPQSPEEYFLRYFDRIVLARYRSRPDLFRTLEDDMGGSVEVTAATSQGGEAILPYFSVRFGFRELADGRTCVAAFGPDLKSLPAPEALAWMADHIESPVFAAADQAFQRWTQRYLHGSWESDDGPLRSLESQLAKIQAMTRFEFGKPLFRAAHNPALRYPVAGNTEAYTFAQLELCRLAVEGLEVGVLELISAELSLPLPAVEPGKGRGSLNTLKALLPERLHGAIHQPLNQCRGDRNKVHGDPSLPAQPFPAFKEFHRRAEALRDAITELRQWLEGQLRLDAEKCVDRESAMRWFPKFDGPLRPDFKIEKFQQAVGKTITSVETGERFPRKGCHAREGIILHFSDGAALGIDVGSNAGNFESQFEGWDASMLCTDLVPIWAPNPRAVEARPDDATT